ncbi:MAG: photosynthetic complex assembly protein PuhC [Rubrivivax sp.]
MTTHSLDTRPATASAIPAWAPWVAGAALLVLLLGVAGLRLGGWNPAQPPGAALVERPLRFADTADGGVAVIDHDTGERVALLHGEQGFVRGVLRGLARERRQQAVSVQRPYLLSLHEDGRLLIRDESTGRRIDLASFGPDNAAVFLRWLPPRSTPGANPP